MMSPQSRSRRDHDEGDETDPTVIEFRSKFKPRVLRQCINGVLKGTNTTAPCIDDNRQRTPTTSVERNAIREDMAVEAQTFHNCLCDLHALSGHCKFNLWLFQRNETILEECFDQPDHDINTPFTHPVRGSDFSCELRRGRAIRCRRNYVDIKPKNTRFQFILNCIANSLKSMKCPATPTAGPGLTTTSVTATTAAPDQARMIIFIMALVISLLLGVLGTWLGIYCWRKKKRKNRPLPPLMARPEHASLPNLYDEEYGEDHIYDIVKPDDSPTSHPVPDLLNRVPSLPPMTNRTPKSRVQVEPDKSKAAFNKTEMYEPLLRGHLPSPDRHNTEPKSPVTTNDNCANDYLPLLPDRNSRDIEPSEPLKRVHPYDSVNESEVGLEAQDESITTPKIIESPPNSARRTPGNDYFILEPQAKSLKETGDGLHSVRQGTEGDNKVDTPAGRVDKANKNSNESNPNDSGYVVSPVVEGDKNTDHTVDVEKGESDSDGYEIPVPVDSTFDIASSFKKNGPRVLDEDREDVLNV